MKTVTFTDAGHKAVIGIIAWRWAMLTTQLAGAGVTFGGTYVAAVHKAQRRTDERLKAELGKAIYAMTGADLPKVNRDAFVVTVQMPAPAPAWWPPRLQHAEKFLPKKALDEARRLREEILKAGTR